MAHYAMFAMRSGQLRRRRNEKKWLELPWRKVRESVEVKLFAEEGELYVLAKSKRSADLFSRSAALRTRRQHPPSDRNHSCLARPRLKC